MDNYFNGSTTPLSRDDCPRPLHIGSSSLYVWPKIVGVTGIEPAGILFPKQAAHLEPSPRNAPFNARDNGVVDLSWNRLVRCRKERKKKSVPFFWRSVEVSNRRYRWKKLRTNRFFPRKNPGLVTGHATLCGVT